MKKIIILVCIIFTIVVLFTSFSAYKNEGGSFTGQCYYHIDEVVINGQKYIVGTTSLGGITICKE